MELKRGNCGKRMERKTARKKKKGCMPMHLPGEIIENILLRIPAEYVIRLKAVCKDWFSLISGRDFVYAHLARHGNEFEQILVCGQPDRRGFGIQCEILRSKHAEDSKFQIKQRQLQKLLGDTNLSFRNSCDGLLLFESTECFIIKPTLYVCNPVTRKCKAVSLPEPCPIVSGWSLVHDVSIGKYKMIGIAWGSDICYRSTLKDDDHDTAEGPQWKELSIRACFCPRQTQPALVNKELHWLASEEVESKLFLCSMDVAKEEFIETQVPFLRRYEARRNIVIEIMGSICVTDYLPNHKELDIWCLEDREKGRWTKKYNTVSEFEFERPVSFHNYPSIVSFHNYPSVDASTESRIIIRLDKQFFVYDAAINVWRKIEFQVKEADMRTRYNFVHINSLVKW